MTGGVGKNIKRRTGMIELLAMLHLLQLILQVNHLLMQCTNLVLCGIDSIALLQRAELIRRLA